MTDGLNQRAITNITELTWCETEKLLSSLLRKKITIRPHESKFGKLAECLDGKLEKHAYSVFHLSPNNAFGLTALTYPFLHQMTNILYGGVLNPNDPVRDSPGNIGVIIAEKISEVIMEGLSTACKEYGKLVYQIYKTVTLPTLISKLSMDDEVYLMHYKIIMGDVETELNIIIPVVYLLKFLPPDTDEDGNYVRKDAVWRSAIQNQVIDSRVMVVAALPEVTMKMSELLALKSGDIIPIGDPTIVDVCLNDTRVFRATAAQANETRIIKILSEC